MKIDWSNAGTSAGFQISQSQIILENGESIDDDCSPVMTKRTDDDYDMTAGVFGLIYVDATTASSRDADWLWILLA